MDECVRKLASGEDRKGRGLQALLEDARAIRGILNGLHSRYNRKVIEQAAIAGVLSPHVIGDIAKANQAADYIAKRLDALAELSQRLLARCREGGASQAEVNCSEERGLSVNVRMGAVETVESTRDRGIAVTVYFGQRKGSASTADLREESLESTVAQAR